MDAPRWHYHLDTRWPAPFWVPPPGCARSLWVDHAQALFPQLAISLSKTPQDPVYHAEGDVWTHTQMAVDALLAQPEYASLSNARAGIAFYAVLLHDISKPSTTRQDQSRIIAPGHSRRGAIDARIALWRHGAPFVLREQVCRIIQTHQVPFFAFNSRSGLRPEYLAIDLSQDRDMELLCLVARADMLGRSFVDAKRCLDEIGLFADLCSEMACFQSPFAFPDGVTRLSYFASGGSRDPASAVFHQENRAEVIVFSALPASGKDHHARTIGLPSVSFDQARSELGLDYGKHPGRVARLAEEKTRALLRSGGPFSINATHLSAQIRERTLDLIRKYNAVPRVLYMEQPLSVILARNSSRDTTLSNTKLMSMLMNWEVPGFDEVERIEFRVNVS